MLFLSNDPMARSNDRMVSHVLWVHPLLRRERAAMKPDWS
jgi:hypothetical protein